MISAGEFRNGVTFEQDGQVLQMPKNLFGRGIIKAVTFS